MTKHKRLLVDKRGYELPGGISALIAAIIEQAATDYINAKTWLRDHPKPEKEGQKWQTRMKAERRLKSAVEFFQSDWYAWMCDIDADELIKMLDAEVEGESKDVSE